MVYWSRYWTWVLEAVETWAAWVKSSWALEPKAADALALELEAAGAMALELEAAGALALELEAVDALTM